MNRVELSLTVDPFCLANAFAVYHGIHTAIRINLHLIWWQLTCYGSWCNISNALKMSTFMKMHATTSITARNVKIFITGETLVSCYCSWKVSVRKITPKEDGCKVATFL